MADEKKQLRQIFKAARAALAPETAVSLSAQVQDRLMASDAYARCRIIVLYAAKDNEILTWRIFEDALESGRAVYFPRIDANAGAITMVRTRARAELVAGAFGVQEPSGTEIAAPSELAGAVICVPGVAFSVTGQRLGRGGGFYDRLISQARGALLTAGLAYSFQVLDTVPETAGDQRLDLIVTQSAIHAPGGAGPAGRTQAEEE